VAKTLPVREISVGGHKYAIEQVVSDSSPDTGASADSRSVGDTAATSSRESIQSRAADRSFAEYVWNGSIVLSHHVASVEPRLVRGRVCVEIGAGLGLLCAVACRHGAEMYVATDGDPIAVDRTVENLLRNGARTVPLSSAESFTAPVAARFQASLDATGSQPEVSLTDKPYGPSGPFGTTESERHGERDSHTGSGSGSGSGSAHRLDWLQDRPASTCNSAPSGSSGWT